MAQPPSDAIKTPMTSAIFIANPRKMDNCVLLLLSTVLETCEIGSLRLLRAVSSYLTCGRHRLSNRRRWNAFCSMNRTNAKRATYRTTQERAENEVHP